MRRGLSSLLLISANVHLRHMILICRTDASQKQAPHCSIGAVGKILSGFVKPGSISSRRFGVAPSGHASLPFRPQFVVLGAVSQFHACALFLFSHVGVPVRQPTQDKHLPATRARREMALCGAAGATATSNAYDMTSSSFFSLAFRDA